MGDVVSFEERRVDRLVRQVEEIGMRLRHLEDELADDWDGVGSMPGTDALLDTEPTRPQLTLCATSTTASKPRTRGRKANRPTVEGGGAS